MHWKTRFDELAAEHNLSTQDFYLLDLVPLVETMWANGSNPYEQLRLLYDFAVKHAANLARVTDGVVVLSESDINGFLDRFAHERPPRALVKELRQIALCRAVNRTDPDSVRKQSDTLIQYCLEIAAASVSEDVDGVSRRFVEAERKILLELLDALKLSPDRLWDV